MASVEIERLFVQLPEAAQLLTPSTAYESGNTLEESRRTGAMGSRGAKRPQSSSCVSTKAGKELSSLELGLHRDALRNRPSAIPGSASINAESTTIVTLP